MSEASYDDFYPSEPKSNLTKEEAIEYGKYFPESAPPPEPDKPDALTALNQALEAIEAGNHYPKEN